MKGFKGASKPMAKKMTMRSKSVGMSRKMSGIANNVAKMRRPFIPGQVYK